MTCAELRELLLEYESGELVIEHRESVEIHLVSCPHCGFYLESYRHTVKICKKLPHGDCCCPLTAAFEARLREALKEHLKEEKG